MPDGKEEVIIWQAAEPWGPFIINAIKAKELYKKNVDYVEIDGKVHIINKSSGRIQARTRWQDNIHQVRLCTTASSHRTHLDSLRTHVTLLLSVWVLIFAIADTAFLKPGNIDTIVSALFAQSHQNRLSQNVDDDSVCMRVSYA